MRDVIEDMIATLSNELDNGDYEFGPGRASVRHALAGRSPGGEPQLDITMSDGAIIQLRARAGMDYYNPAVGNHIEREAVARLLEDLAGRVRRGEVNSFDWEWQVATGVVDAKCVVVPKLSLDCVTIKFNVGDPDGESEDDGDPA